MKKVYFILFTLQYLFFVVKALANEDEVYSSQFISGTPEVYYIQLTVGTDGKEGFGEKDGFEFFGSVKTTSVNGKDVDVMFYHCDRTKDGCTVNRDDLEMDTKTVLGSSIKDPYITISGSLYDADNSSQSELLCVFDESYKIRMSQAGDTVSSSALFSVNNNHCVLRIEQFSYAF